MQQLIPEKSGARGHGLHSAPCGSHCIMAAFFVVQGRRYRCTKSGKDSARTRCEARSARLISSKS
eukprot:scaffold307260_cov32-Tisochrysis_lutea.AAC.2